MADFSKRKDCANRIRNFLIRENALGAVRKLANPAAKTAIKLSEEKRSLALRALQKPFANKTLDEIMKERPELSDGEEIKIIIPSKYKQRRDPRDKK